jgi:hypothetical protein
MPKRTFVEGKVLDRLFTQFYGSNNDEKTKVIDSIRKTSPGLANALDSWEGSFIDLMKATKKIKEKHNQDTTEIDKLLKAFRGH